MIVIDADVAVKFSVRQPLSDRAIELLWAAKPIVGPDLVVAEVVNALLGLARTGKVDAKRAFDAVEFAPRWFEELVPARDLHRQAYRLAEEVGHSAYDCFYLALAVARDCQLVTMDEHFLRKLEKTPHSRHAVHLAHWRP